jgi:hypothetical protein
MELHQKGLKNVNVKMMMLVFIIELGFPVMAITLVARPNQSPFHGALSQIPRLHNPSHFGFFAIVIYPF